MKPVLQSPPSRLLTTEPVVRGDLLQGFLASRGLTSKDTLASLARLEGIRVPKWQRYLTRKVKFCSSST